MDDGGNEKTLCPLANFQIECREDCEWYDEEREQCSIKTIAAALRTEEQTFYS